MSSQYQASVAVKDAKSQDYQADRTWFLADSEWDDAVWRLNPTNILEEKKILKIRWDFLLPNGTCFTDPTYNGLLETSRQLIALIRAHSLSTGLAQRASTVVGYAGYLRTTVRWMVHAGYAKFSEINDAAILQFIVHLRKLKNQKGMPLASTTILKYLYLFEYLYRYNDCIDDGLQSYPFPSVTARNLAGVRDGQLPRWPYTPDHIAVPLIQGSIDLLDHGSPAILEARRIYMLSICESHKKKIGPDAANNAVNKLLNLKNMIVHPIGTSISSVRDLSHSIELLYSAVFIVVAYLTGARASEILNLSIGCIEQRSSSESSIDVIVGAIYKRQAEYQGRAHEWVAPPAVVKAIQILEKLSDPHREKTGRNELWLRRNCGGGAREWDPISCGVLEICAHRKILESISRLSDWLSLPKHMDRKWLITTHQGRKTFARFASLRDRSTLFALAQQFGHRERATTDQGYSGTDYRLNNEIDAEILEQSVQAWEQMLASPVLGGRAGAEIIAKRPSFRGVRLKDEIKNYARMLVEAGLTLGVCNWGFCVYRVETSSCLGNAVGPNPVRREPTTCAKCANFSVSDKHKSFWIDQVRQCDSLLLNPALPLQTLRIARQRLSEAKLIIQSITTSSEVGDTSLNLSGIQYDDDA